MPKNILRSYDTMLLSWSRGACSVKRASLVAMTITTAQSHTCTDVFVLLSWHAEIYKASCIGSPCRRLRDMPCTAHPPFLGLHGRLAFVCPQDCSCWLAPCERPPGQLHQWLLCVLEGQVRSSHAPSQGQPASQHTLAGGDLQQQDDQDCQHCTHGKLAHQASKQTQKICTSSLQHYFLSRHQRIAVSTIGDLLISCL